MGIAKRHVGDRNVLANRVTHSVTLGHCNVYVSKRGPSNGAQGLIAHDKPVLNTQTLANCQERFPLPAFGALSIADVQRSSGIVANRQGRAHARVHASTEKYDGSGLLWLRRLHVINKPQTPFNAGSQMNLCNCNPRRAGTLSTSIHSANSCGSSRQCELSRAPVAPLRKAGENRTALTR